MTAPFVGCACQMPNGSPNRTASSSAPPTSHSLGYAQRLAREHLTCFLASIGPWLVSLAKTTVETTLGRVSSFSLCLALAYRRKTPPVARLQGELRGTIRPRPTRFLASRVWWLRRRGGPCSRDATLYSQRSALLSSRASSVGLHLVGLCLDGVRLCGGTGDLY